jgi:hypothetical protein
MTLDPSASLRHDESGRYNKNALVARAGVARTFGGLGGFLALMFLGAGIYLLQEAFSDPLRAEAVGLIAGAFILALSTMLIYFLFRPRPRLGRSKIRRRTSLHSLQGDTDTVRSVEMPVPLAIILPAQVSRKENTVDSPLPA